MPRAPKVCAHPTCGRLADDCTEHKRKPWEGSTRRTELPPDWARRRRKVLKRDPICTDGRACGGLALSQAVHHGEGGKLDHSLANLSGICHRCHAVITSEQAAAGRAMLG